MDFSLSEEQTLLRNSVQSFLAGRYDFDTRYSTINSETGWRPELWREMAELGLLAAPFPEALGGIDGGPVETMLLMEEFGRYMVVEPYLETVVMAGGLLRDAGSEAQQEAHLPGIIGGDSVWAVAWAEPQGRYNPADIATTASASDGGYVLAGKKAVVEAAPWADKLIVSARSDGRRRESKGVSLFIVDKAAEGVNCRDFRTIDGRRASEITLKDVQVGPEALIGELNAGLPLLQRMLDEATAAICADAVGCMKALNEATKEYTTTRKQFGVPIASFQVLQHRMVDMFIATEQATSMAIKAALKLDAEDAERERAIAGAKVQIGQSARYVSQEAVQLHGGVGVTDELNVGHYFKRLTAIARRFGDEDYQLRRYARTG